MFVKKIEKNSVTYYILTICNRVEAGTGKGKDKDTQFISCFIPEKLALLLIDNGVTLKDKTTKEQN